MWKDFLHWAMKRKVSFTRRCSAPSFLPRFCLLCIVCLSLRTRFCRLWKFPPLNAPACSCSPHHRGQEGRGCVSPQHLCQAVPYIVLMEEPPSCHAGISSLGFDWIGGGKLLCSNFSLASGHTQPVCHPLICLAYHFMIHIKSCGSMVRAIMNYLLNRGRFTDDWSICVVRTSIEERKKCDTSVFLWNTGSSSRNKAGVHHLDWMDFSCRFGHHMEDGKLFSLIFFLFCFSNMLIE